jgi:hypothetical protein
MAETYSASTNEIELDGDMRRDDLIDALKRLKCRGNGLSEPIKIDSSVRDYLIDVLRGK